MAGLKREFVTKGAVSVFFKIINFGLSFGISAGLARTLTVSDFGIYSFWIATVTVIAVPIQMGFPYILLREATKVKNGQYANELKGLSIFSLSTICLFCAIIFVGALTAHGIFLIKIPSLFYLSLLLAASMAITSSLGGGVRGYSYSLMGQIPELILRPILFIGLLSISFFLSGKTNSAEETIYLYLWSSLITSSIAIGLYFFVSHKDLLIAKAAYSLKNWLPSMGHFSILGGVQVLNGQLGILALGVFNPDTDVAIYKVALQLSLIVSFGLHAITMVSAPYFSKFFYANDKEKLQNIIVLSSKLNLILSLPCLLILFIFGATLIKNIFGPLYAAAYWPLVALSLSQFSVSLFGPVVTIMNVSGHERETFKVSLYSLAITLLSLVFLIPIFGILGAAIASLLATLVNSLLLYLKAKKLIGIKTGIFSLTAEN